MIHVGNMANKGTQALLLSDVSVIKDVVKGDVGFSVSTTDVEGVRRLNLSLNAVLPPMVDIPYEKADFFAKRFGYARKSFTYLAFAVASSFFMFVQIAMSVMSAILVKVGLKGFYRSEVLRYMKDCNVVVSYSDENFKETASLLPLNIYWIATWWSMLLSRAWDILVAKFLGKPVVLFPNSVGPFRTSIGRFLSKLALNNCSYVLVREPVSYEIVKSLEIRPPKILTSDTTLLFKPTYNSSFDDCSHPTVGVSPGVYSHSLSEKEVDNYVLAHAKALDTAIKNYGFSVVFLPHYVSGFRYDDLEICKLIRSKMENVSKTRIVNAKTVEEFKSLIDRMGIVISSKMHPAVLAVSACVPVLCVAYDHKQTGFFMSLGLSDCVISLRDVSYEKLLSKIDHVWSGRDDINALLKVRVPTLQKRIKRSIELAMASCIEENYLFSEEQL